MIHYYTPNALDKEIESKNTGFIAVDFALPIEELNVLKSNFQRDIQQLDLLEIQNLK